SPADFEELVGDLLSASWGKRLERFTAGKDGGIDLRCLSLGGQDVIVQCKHTPGMTFQALFNALKKDELPKVKVLAPSRYVLVLSQGLTPANKTKLFKLLSPFVLSEDDIIGRQQLNDLLKDFPKVETANFKLWFTSTAVLKRVLHNAERCQTEFEVERVSNALPLFVQSNALPRAIDILNETRVLVVSGVPGIGKTTLADMILFSHLEQGYEPVVIQDSMEQARKLFDKNVKQIFYFDDFLGQTFLHDRPDLLDKNQDAALINFIDAVRRTKHSRFILTTREHILRKALDISEKLATSSLVESRCVLQLDDYSYVQKARILYNHLYFGDLPVAYKEELLKEDFFLDVIKHKNFSPRIISWLSGYIRVKQVPLEAYRAHVKSLLDSPETIWRHAFEKQISEAARNLLLVLGLQGDYGNVVDLQPAWEKLHRHSAAKYNFAMKPHEFRRALQDLEGSFVALHAYGVAFSNPSVRDFMQLIIRQSDTIAEDLVAGALRFRHLEELRNLCEGHENEAIGRVINADNGN
ncbi:MAG: restriction endonuclease, partial [Prosthecobacter sp.]|nr:restriction endonuclease [Prosthecobacter sp.]